LVLRSCQCVPDFAFEIIHARRMSGIQRLFERKDSRLTAIYQSCFSKCLLLRVDEYLLKNRSRRLADEGDEHALDDQLFHRDEIGEKWILGLEVSAGFSLNVAFQGGFAVD